MSARVDVNEILSAYRQGGGWSSLARGITALENARPWEVVEAPAAKSVHVVGITGPPGAGKSTLTAGLMHTYRETGGRVAVLAVDPSSPVSGGAVLGDRVRMEGQLAGRSDVFVRSIATRGVQGGLAGATGAIVRLLEASEAFDVIIVETAGAGQTDLAVAGLADTVVLVTVPGLGDGVQTIKAGLLELADVLVVNMADRPGATDTMRQHRVSLGRRTPVLQTVATEGVGLDELRDTLDQAWAGIEGSVASRRAERLATVDRPSAVGREETERWRRESLDKSLARVPARRESFRTLSGLAIDDVYTSADVAGLDERADRGRPGEYPFTRGVHARMYRARPWTSRQVAGFGQGEDTNRRYKYLLKHGETGLSTDFDLPTLLGHDSDHPVFNREVGKIGVAVDTIEDAHALFADIPLDRVSTSLTINAPAAVLLAMYRVVGAECGVAGEKLTGTCQNDILKEYTAQNEFIFAPGLSVDLVVDTMEYGARVMPSFNPVNVSGYHIREAGATAVEEVALTLSAGIAYLERARERGIEVDSVAPRLSFFFDIHNDFFEEIAKFRAARRLWARLTRERLRCADPRSWMLRTHAQTAGVSLTVQQPLNNVARTAVQALAGVLGGVQSMHTNSLDEAYAIPSEEAIKVAVRTQQVLLHESGAADVVDPLAGSYYVESLTTEIEDRARVLIEEIDDHGGMIAAVESGFANKVIADSSWDQQVAIETNDRVVVGVNEFCDEEDSGSDIPLFELDPQARERQLERLAAVKREREERRAAAALRSLQEEAAKPDRGNLMPFIEEGVKARCTVGELCGVLREVWGEYRPPSVI